MIRKLAQYIRNLYYDVKKLIKLMGTNLKENIVWCNN